MSAELSVVVCTRNRINNLKRCLASFERICTNHAWELVIVDNGSSDGTWDYLTSRSKSVGTGKMIIVSVPRIGLSRARNDGVRVSNAELVAFTDDDCYVSEDYIDTIIKAFKANPDIGFLAGRVMLHDPKDIRFTVKENPRAETFQPYSFLATGSIHGANMAFRRSVLVRIGGFDLRFGPGTPFIAEDVVAAADALWMGYSGAYDPAPTVFHHHGRQTRAEYKKVAKSYDKGRGAYFARFIRRSDSRRVYIHAWCSRLKDKTNSPFRRSRTSGAPSIISNRWDQKSIDMKRSKIHILFREIVSGLYYGWLSRHDVVRL